MRLVALALFAAAPPWLHPWPIGSGARYHPGPTSAAVRSGSPVGSFRCGHAPVRYALHLELFARRRVVVIPARIGHGPGCVYPLRTSTPTGVIEVASGTATVGDLFRVWGRTLGPRRLLSFRSDAGTLAFVSGRRVTGDPRAIRLRPRMQLVLEIAGYVPPHPSYLFPKGTP
jgi:hypothetical protein